MTQEAAAKKDTQRLQRAIVDGLEDVKAQDITVFNTEHLSPLFEHPDQYILLHDNEGAASIFDWSAPGVWQGHSMFLPRRRGKEGIQSAKDMIGWMFDHGAQIIWGMTPTSEDYRRVHMFNRLIGFKARGLRTDAAGREVRLFKMER